MALLEVKDLRKSFDNTTVLDGVSFSMERGEVLAIIGSSGSGKTTLLRCLNFLETADSGTIQVGEHLLFDGSAQSSRNTESIRKNRLFFGLVFQSFNLFPQYTVLGNLTLAARLASKDKNIFSSRQETFKDIDSRAMELLERVGLTHKRDAYPCELSGGQQQRVAIARALMLTPDILCFDEPTSALDPELTQEVLRVIRDLKSGENTMIVVTHEMEFARNVADKILFMANGIIEEYGTPDEIFEHPSSEILKSFLNNTQTFN